MATGFQFEHPSFNWGAPDVYQEFQRFKQHVEFTFKGPLVKAEPKDRAGWLGLWIGQQGREVYKTFKWEENEQDDPNKILDKLETYIRPRTNKRVARFKAVQRKQGEGESFDNFVKDLRLLLMDCDYTNTEDILTDLIISGVRHAKVQERMLDKGSDLNIAKAIEIGQQFELSQKQLKMIRGEEILKISEHKRKDRREPNRGTNNRRPYQQSTRPDRNKHDKSSYQSKCGNCGTIHSKDKCPAKGTQCKYCKKPDHWLKVCRKRLRRINLIQETDQYSSHSEDEILYISTVKTESSRMSEDKWIVDLQVDRKTLPFRIDTGARCSILSKHSFNSLRLSSKYEINGSRKLLKSYTGHTIQQIGKIKLPVKYKDREMDETFEIVDIEQDNIISGDFAENLKLVKRIDTIDEIDAPNDLSHDFPELVKTSGTLPGKYRIKIAENAKGVVHPPRRLPAAIKDRAVAELRSMEEYGYITKVEEPTEWVSSMVVAVRNGKVRICIDPKDLNEVIQRENYPLKTIEDVIPMIPNAKVFSVLDAKSGFLQIKLEEPSSYLTTFNTPIGRYRWLRLPFGIKCAPEIYQRIMDQMLEGIAGATAIIDDILIAGCDIEEHDNILKQVVERATSHNLRLNFDKCFVRKSEVAYMGHVITDKGLRPDPAKVRAIIDMPAPQNKEGVRRFLGLVQYLAKFLPNLSQVDAPLRSLLKSDVLFTWESEQEKSFQELKRLCSTSPILAFFDVSKPVEIECDASQDGLGAVLMQEGRVIAYASRSLSESEKRYAQIEKEMLSIVFSTKKFHCYILGKKTFVYNDHKPLEQIFKKPLLAAPLRIQKMMLKLQWYDIQVCYRKGKDMKISDALSRAFLPFTHEKEEGNIVQDMICMISISTDKYSEIKETTKTELHVLQETILNGWPDIKSESPFEVREYWDSRAQLSVLDGIIYKGLRIVIPPSLREGMLKLIHKSHLGMTKCKKRAREVMFWPCMNSNIEKCVQDCALCASYQNQQSAEPLKPTSTPDLPFSLVGCDLFDFQSKTYILTVDYYSKYIDVLPLESSNTTSIVNALKSIFATHGIPTRLRSDNGPQFSSSEFRKFCRELGIDHETSSPHFQSANGEAERSIQTVKNLWRKSDDKHLSLLDYRTTPLEGIDLSPSQLLMGRRPRNTLPASKDVLKPNSHNPLAVKRHFDREKEKQKFYYDKRRGVKELPPLNTESAVRMTPLPGTKKWIPGTVTKHYNKPRSYVVQSDDPGNHRLYRRNRKHLRTSTRTASKEYDRDISSDNFANDDQNDIQPNEHKPNNTASDTNTSRSVVSVANRNNHSDMTTRSGRRIKKPERLDL